MCRNCRRIKSLPLQKPPKRAKRKKRNNDPAPYVFDTHSVIKRTGQFLFVGLRYSVPCCSLLGSRTRYKLDKYFIFIVRGRWMHVRTKTLFSFLLFAIVVAGSGCGYTQQSRFQMSFLPPAP